LWIILIVALLNTGVEKTTFTKELTGAIFPLLILPLMQFTIIGQFGNWLITLIYDWVTQWGTPGFVLYVILCSLAGLKGLQGLPVGFLVLFGVIYPRADLLVVTAAPPLVLQIPLLLLMLRKVGQARAVARWR